MAARDILKLDNSMAPRLIRCLYLAALILIAVMVIFGVARGVRIMSLPPPPAISGNAAPTDGIAPPPPGMMQRFGDDRMMMNRPMMDRMRERRFGRRFGGPLFFWLDRNPVLAGGLTIFWALLRGVIVLMIIRVLAEVGLAVLAMPRKSEL